MSELSTGRLLTMNWLEGTPLLTFIKAHGEMEMRNRIAYNMFRAWYVPFYYYGVIHGDPHLGNYTLKPDGSVNLLDFGCIRIFGASFVQGVIDLYHALQNDDRDLAVHAYEVLGLRQSDQRDHRRAEPLGRLRLWAAAGGPHAPHPGKIIRRLRPRGRRKRACRSAPAGSGEPPREFVFMDRAAIGLGSVFLHLGAEINWHRLFRELIDGFDVKELDRRQKKLLKKFDLHPVAGLSPATAPSGHGDGPAPEASPRRRARASAAA